MIKCQKISYGGRLKRNEPQQNTLPFIKDMYTNIMACVRAYNDEFDVFPIKIGLHRGSALSQYIFTLVMDEITRTYKETFLDAYSLLMM
jgi:hypothetical protein